jgi:hypothetical protein
MIDLNTVETLADVTVYRDDADASVYYLQPEQPRFRRDEHGNPIFTFLKYRTPVTRPNGQVGGGYLIFDVEFTVPDDALATIRDTLQKRLTAEAQAANAPAPDLVIAPITFTKGTAKLLLNADDGTLIQRVFSAGTPSLYGRNISTYAVELTAEGATLFESALRDSRGGAVSVVYDLYFPARLPPLKVTASFDANAFYSFVQDVVVHERVCASDDYAETLHETMSRTDCRKIVVDPGLASPEVVDKIRTWATKALDDATERLAIEALQLEDPAVAQKWYSEHDFETVHREVVRNRVASFSLTYDEKCTVPDYHVAPQGTLPNITTMVDDQGKPIRWEDHARDVDLSDPFLQKVKVAVQVNADFEHLPIHSVEVKASYLGKPMIINDQEQGEHRFTSADDVAHFEAFRDTGAGRYSYSYQVNYDGGGQALQSPTVETDDSALTINVDDIGVLDIEILAGDIDFAQVRRAELTIAYQDQAGGVARIERNVVLDAARPAQRVQEIIYVPRKKPYQWTVTYFMTDGKEYALNWRDGTSRQLYVNDPFTDTRTVSLRAVGDLDTKIENIFVDLSYRDDGNHYQKTAQIALNSRQPFFDWTFPVIDSAAGKVRYSGTISYRKSAAVDTIPETVAATKTITLPPEDTDRISVLVVADMVNFALVKLVRVELQYDPGGQAAPRRADFVFGGTRPTSQTWDLTLKDTKEYRWKATYYLADGRQVTDGPHTGSDLTLILEPPA